MKKSLLVVSVLFVLALPTFAEAQCVSPPPNMTAWWTGDNHALDIIGTNNATVNGGVTYAAGMVDQAFSFDGTTGYLSVPDDPTLRATTAFTIDFWVYFDVMPTGALADSFLICEKDNNYLLAYRADLHELDLCFFDTLASPGCRIGALASLGDISGAWHHIAVTSANPVGQTSAEFHFYLDGAEIVNTANSNPPSVPGGWSTAASGDLYIGRRTQTVNGEWYFDGMLDEIEIFNRMLSLPEVAAIYNAGSDGKCKPPVPVELRSFEID